MSFVDVLRNAEGFASLKGADETRIKSAEAALGLRFSDEYRAYLKAFGVASAGSHEFTGICDSARLNVVDVSRDARKYFGDIPADWYVVEEANIDGIVIWQDDSGSVYESVPGKKPRKIFNSLQDYFSA